MTTPNDRIKEIRERLEKATDGPWEWEYQEDDGEYTISLTHMTLDGSDEDGLPGAFDDREFIAHAPEDILYLLKELDTAQKLNHDMLPAAEYGLWIGLGEEERPPAISTESLQTAQAALVEAGKEAEEVEK